MKSIFQENITAIHILEELKCCKFSDDFSKVKELMESEDFDIIGVAYENKTLGYFKLRDLINGKEIIHEFGDLIEESRPLIEVLSLLKEKSRVFVLINNETYGIITHSDLQKIAVRIFLFGLISLLEMRMTDTIRSFYPDNEWKEYISDEKRLNNIKSRFSEQKQNNENLDLLECSDLSDKQKIILKTDAILKDLDYPNKEFKKIMGRCINLRNNLAHSKDLNTSKENDSVSWIKIIDLTENIYQLLEKFDKMGKGV